MVKKRIDFHIDSDLFRCDQYVEDDIIVLSILHIHRLSENKDELDNMPLKDYIFKDVTSKFFNVDLKEYTSEFISKKDWKMT